MRISIEFDSCWQTGFLGDDPKKPINADKKSIKNFHNAQGYEQKFVATSKTRGEKPTPITKSTVLGILCRLIGDQRKLYQAKNSENYYFVDIEDKITFSLAKVDHTSQELMYLTNKSDDRCAQSSFLGVLSSDNPWFFSDISRKLWSVLFLDKTQLLDFILSEQHVDTEVDSSPKKLIARIEAVSNTKQETGAVLMTKQKILDDKNKEIEKKQKQLESTIQKGKDKPAKTQSQKTKHEEKVTTLNQELAQLKNQLTITETDNEINAQDNKINAVVVFLLNEFPECKYWDNGTVHPKRLYASAIYLQAKRMIESGYKMDFAIIDKGKNAGEISIKGVSKNSNANQGFSNVRDWLNPMTGKRKKAVGTPCIVQKQSGTLDVIININRERAKQVRDDIERAGVSSFYFGKKGLAYVTHIDTREVKH